LLELDLAEAHLPRHGHDSRLEEIAQRATKSEGLFFNREVPREQIFFTDARTFRERHALVKDCGSQGFCSRVLGEEDTAIWELFLLPIRVRSACS
jgi:hypothetical protein